MPKNILKELPELELADKKTIGERIADVRKASGLSQLELSKKIGITRALLSEYETGRTRVYGEMISRIAISLSITPDRLLGFIHTSEEEGGGLSLRYTKRIKEIEGLPEHKKRALLKTLDDLIKANKTNL